MSPQHIILAVFTSAFVSALAMFYWCEFGKGGRRDYEIDLEAEVVLNVKFLKEKYDWILERANFRRTLSDPIKLAEILELAKSVDAAIPKDLTDGAREGGRSISGQVDNLSPSPFTWVCDKRGHKFTHVATPRKCVFCGVDE